MAVLKVLFVYSGNVAPMPFIAEQKKSLQNKGVVVEDFLIKGKGWLGYLKNIVRLRRAITRGGYDLVHAHYGLSALLCVMQRRAPVVSTFHGSDLNVSRNVFWSRVAALLSSANIVVNSDMQIKLSSLRSEVLPCGVDLEVFKPLDKSDARLALGLNAKKKYILFSSSFTNPVKNYPLAKEAVELSSVDCEILELKDRSRNEVNLLMNASDMLLMTSISEGSPQVVKEAMACNLPVISNDVGDVDRLIKGVNHCFLVHGGANSFSKCIKGFFSSSELPRSNGRDHVSKFSLCAIADRIIDVYLSVLSPNQS